jgi:nucleoside-diphosphate-sugar epimerase
LTYFKTKGKESPQRSIGMIDVVDVAEAHLRAAKQDQIENQRFIMVQQTQIMSHLGQMLNEETELIEVDVKPDSFDIFPLKNVLGMELKDAV